VRKGEEAKERSVITTKDACSCLRCEDANRRRGEECVDRRLYEHKVSSKLCYSIILMTLFVVRLVPDQMYPFQNVYQSVYLNSSFSSSCEEDQS